MSDKCWCGGKVLAFVPEDDTTRMCVSNNDHDWKADAVTAAKNILEGVTEGPWSLNRESCDCGDGYGCPHAPWPYAIHGPANQVVLNEKNPYSDRHKRDYGHQVSEISELSDADADFVAAARSLVPELIAEVERLHSWGGLMSLLDEHYPEDIFPTLPDTSNRDPGPRIISLIRRINEIRSEVSGV